MGILSPLALVWWLFIVSFLILHLCYYRFNSLPLFLRQLFVYGKVRSTIGSQKSQKSGMLDLFLSVPKSYFPHFYVTSFIWNTFLLVCLINAWYLGGTFPQLIIDLLTFLTYYPDEPCSHLTIILAQLLIVLQATRRSYESIFVSSYSNSRIHIFHYLMGMFYYVATSISALSKAPNLTRGTFFQLSDIQVNHVLGVALFLWASLHHHRAHQILADLRKGRNDKSHKVPSGDWFEYVSCPHYLAEILIYLSLQMVLGFDHTLWWAVLLFTLANQTAAGRYTHRWYRQNFNNYPRDRTAVIPWIL